MGVPMGGPRLPPMGGPPQGGDLHRMGDGKGLAFGFDSFGGELP